MSCMVPVCRGCLCGATDGKLLDIRQGRLDHMYEDIMQFTFSDATYLPPYLCSYCAALLIKCATFKRRCERARELLNCLLLLNKIVTTEHIANINRETNELTLPLSIECELRVIAYTHADIDVKEELKEENTEENDEIDKEDNFDDTNSITNTDDSKTSEKKEVVKSKSRGKKTENVGDDDANFEEECEVDTLVLSKEEQKKEVEERQLSNNYIKSAYKCEKCYKGFLSKVSLENHMVKHDPRRGRLSCSICGYRFSKTNHWTQHAKIHRVRYVCRRCGYESRTRHQAKVHHDFHRGHVFKCQYCGACHTSATGHLSHVRLQHPAEQTPCEGCGETFVGTRGLLAHRQRTAGRCGPAGGRLSEQVGSEYVCGPCDKRFPTAVSLHLHTRRVRENAPRARGAAGPGRRREPPGGPPADRYVCELCGKKFHAVCHLKSHQLVHDGIRSFKCTFCPKAYFSEYSLKEHVRVHSGERPFKCSMCEKTFASKSNYIRHKLIHSGVKRYGCEVCGKRFTQSNSAKMHVRTVHMRLPAPPRRRGQRKDQSKGSVVVKQ